MGTVHPLGGEQCRVGIIQHGRDQIATIVPVAQVLGGVYLQAPGPDAVFAVGVGLIFAVPIVSGVLVIHSAAVGLDPFSLGIQPRFSGIDGILAVAGFLFGKLLLLLPDFLEESDLLCFRRADGIFRGVQFLQGSIQFFKKHVCLGHSGIADQLLHGQCQCLRIAFNHFQQPWQGVLQHLYCLLIFQQVLDLHTDIIDHRLFLTF